MNNRKPIQGFTLVEIMIAMVIGLILILGIATIFTNTTNNIRLQRGIANIQESGRIAVDLMSSDIGGTGSQYCSAMNLQLAIDGFTPQRPFLSMANFGLPVMGNDDLAATYTPSPSGTTGGLFYGLVTRADLTPPPAPPSITPYLISARYAIQGHNCVGNVCTPALTVLGAARTSGGATAATVVVGPLAGQRVPNTDVLTVRTLVGNGASIVSSGAVINMAPGSLARLGLDSVPAGRLANRLVMVADCDQSTIALGTFASNTLTLSSGAVNTVQVGRVFDMENQWLTVTYFLQFVADPNSAGRVIPALMRRENGRALEEIARGVERLDFRYAVNAPDAPGINPENNVVWLTADQVHSANGGAIPCPVSATDTTETDCLWRSVTAVEVGLLANSVDRLAINDDRFTYSMETQREAMAPDRMVHREFRFIVPIKSWAR